LGSPLQVDAAREGTELVLSAKAVVS
jgi:hypothetical protein